MSEFLFNRENPYKKRVLFKAGWVYLPELGRWWQIDVLPSLAVVAQIELEIDRRLAVKLGVEYTIGNRTEAYEDKIQTA